MRVLGLDISTSTIGVAVIDVDGYGNITLAHCDHYKPTHDGDLLDRLAKTRDDMRAIITELAPDQIAIEDIIAYMPNRSRAATIIALAQVNRMVGLVARDHLGFSPTLLGVLTIRHGLKYGTKLPDKENMPVLVAKRLGMKKFPYVMVKKRGKKRPVRAEESNDRADAVAVALYHAYALIDRLPNKKSKDQ